MTTSIEQVINSLNNSELNVYLRFEMIESKLYIERLGSEGGYDALLAEYIAPYGYYDVPYGGMKGWIIPKPEGCVHGLIDSLAMWYKHKKKKYDAVEFC